MVTFNNTQIEVIEKITRLSKMDWLIIDEKGRCRDTDNGMRVLSPKKAIRNIIDGVPYDTFSALTPFEMGVFLSIISRVLE